MPTNPRTRFALTVVVTLLACGAMIASALLAASGFEPALLTLFAVPVAAGHGVLRIAKLQAQREQR